VMRGYVCAWDIEEAPLFEPLLPEDPEDPPVGAGPAPLCDPLAPVGAALGVLDTPRLASAIPLAIVEVVTQLLEEGVEKGAAGVTVSPAVYVVPGWFATVPVQYCAKMENSGWPLFSPVGYHPGG